MSAIDDRRLGELLALERDHDDMPADAEARMLAAIGDAIGGGGDGGDGGGGDAGPQTPSGGGADAVATGAAKASSWASTALARAAWVALGAVGGASGHAVLASRGADAPAAIAVPAAPTAQTSVTVTTAEAPAPSAVAVADLPSARSTANARPAAPAPTTPPRDDGRIAQERSDLDVARAALSRGRVDASLEAIDRHVRTYGEGHFAEEREVLAVQALASAGRRSEAAARAARFRAKYPNSLFGAAIGAPLADGG